MCSSAELFGRVTVEAQISGSIVIGANSGATIELIEDGKTGLLYQQGNAQELAERIIWAIDNPQKSREIAKAGQEYARKTYSKENNADGVIKVYEEILGRTIV